MEHRFHDFRVDGLQPELLQEWLESALADKLVNRRSTTWRQLTEAQRRSDGEDLLNLLLEHPTLIKRPVFVTDRVAVVGFDRGELAEL
jgi:arsenate reductase